MKILKRGVVPNPNYRGICGHCETEVEAEPHEVATHHPDQRDPRETTTYTVICPLCKRGIYMKKITSILPPRGR